ncbi:hypothetical protein GDO78_009397 [Eleutherodactylus coqui]|uniref:Uncharacterized protein n=1 Tax=Eleutherodactylus coqui TaxID=57060 RepID=A0A8J6F7S5_ELECQ|nr:hypothetical protein GDO78_009397 [Eleutherodactylus coqui]
MISVVSWRPCCVYKDIHVQEAAYAADTSVGFCPVAPMAPLTSLGLPLLRLSALHLVKSGPVIGAHAW